MKKISALIVISALITTTALANTNRTVITNAKEDKAIAYLADMNGVTAEAYYAEQVGYLHKNLVKEADKTMRENVTDAELDASIAAMRIRLQAKRQREAEIIAEEGL